MSEIVLINVSGQDKPGLTSSLTAILARYQINILDIGQAVIHDTLSLGMLIEIPAAAEPAPVLKDLVFRAYELDIDIRFTPISAAAYDSWVEHQENQRYIITLLGRRITAEQISRIAGLISSYGLNIDDISRLSGRIALENTEHPGRSCIELAVRGLLPDVATTRSALMGLASELGIDLAFQEDDIYRRNRRLVAFDMDSTLIQQEIIDELARAAGVGDKVAQITASAMRGEVDFKDAFTQRLQLLKGLDESVLEQIAADLPLTEGAKCLIANLKDLGYKIAILSGGFTYFTRQVAAAAGFDHQQANELEWAEGRLTGGVVEPILGAAEKLSALQSLAASRGIAARDTLAVGDGANDLAMIQGAGLGVAYHAKPIVAEAAAARIDHGDLTALLYLQGYRADQIKS